MTCPVCRSGSAIQKVSAIVASGTGSYNGAGYGVAFGPGGSAVVPSVSSGTTTTHLAAALAYPIPPRVGGCMPVVGLVLLVLAFGPGVTLVNSGLEGAPPFAPVLVIGLAGALLLVRVALLVRRRQRGLPAWQRAQQRWNELYYCYRDDVVFDPASGSFRPLHAARELIRG